MSQRNVRGSISFELRKYGGGRWTLDSVYDDKELAATEAQSLMERFKAILAVRVVAVAEENGQFREWTVFKQGVMDEPPPAPRPPSRAAAAPATAPPAPSTVPRTRETTTVERPKKQRMSSRAYYARLAGGMIIVVAAAILGMVALRMMQ